MQSLTKVFMDAALEGEMDEHLGYGEHEAAGRDCGNSRNGKRSKQVLTNAGPVEVAVSRDRDGSFELQLVKLPAAGVGAGRAGVLAVGEEPDLR